jgi:phosphoribosylglycinamide formyltransferase-1
VLVISNRAGAFALERARKAGLRTLVIEKRACGGASQFDKTLCSALQEANVGLVVLAGFLAALGPATLAAFPRRIVNIHPALLPSFGGRGFYGLHVHEAALKRGVKITGATVHFVSAEIDGGEIIAQKAVAVLDNDTPETLQRRVMEEAEWQILPTSVEKVCAELS